MVDWTRVEMVRGNPVQICILETDQIRQDLLTDWMSGVTPMVLACWQVRLKHH